MGECCAARARRRPHNSLTNRGDFVGALAMTFCSFLLAAGSALAYLALELAAGTDSNDIR